MDGFLGRTESAAANPASGMEQPLPTPSGPRISVTPGPAVRSSEILSKVYHVVARMLSGMFDLYCF